MKDLFEPAAKKSKRPIPFSFVLDLLDKADPVTRPMFGCTSIYVGEKIVLILREKTESIVDNGIWVATTEEHHASLREDFPSLRSIKLFGGGTTGWQNLPVEAHDFEESATRLCECILEGDLRIGKIPKPKSKKKTPRKAAKRPVPNRNRR